MLRSIDVEVMYVGKSDMPIDHRTAPPVIAEFSHRKKQVNVL